MADLDEIKSRLNELSSELPMADAAQPVTLSLRVQLAQALTSLDDVRRAGELCDEILQASPSHKQAHICAIDAALRGKDYRAAFALIDRALARFADDPALQLRKANGLREIGHFDEAVGVLQRLLIEQPENNGLKISIARNWISAGKNDAADSMFLEVLSTDPKNRDAWTGRINIAFSAGDHHAATDRAERALQYLPNDPVLTARAATAMAKTGRLVKAITLLRGVIAQSAVPHIEAQLVLSGLLQDAGDLFEADSIIKTVLARQPDDPAALNRYIGTSLARGDIGVALLRCDAAMQKLPKDVSFIRKKAILQRQAGQLDNAIETLRVLDRDYPTDLASRAELARALMARQDPDAAELIFVEILKTHPSNRSALLGRVDIAEARGDLEQAMTLLEHQIDLASNLDAQPPVTDGPLQDATLVVKLFGLALKKGDDRRIAAIAPQISLNLPRLDDQALISLLAPLSQGDIAVEVIQEVARRDTILPNLALEILRIAHGSGDDDLSNSIENRLRDRLPTAQRDLFRIQAARLRAGPQLALKATRQHRKSERTPAEALELGNILIAAGESWLAFRYIRRCVKKWPNNSQCYRLLIRAHLMTGHAQAALALLDAADHLNASANPDPLRMSILPELGQSDQALDLILAQAIADPGVEALQQLVQLNIAVGNMAEAERHLRKQIAIKAGAGKAPQHFQASHLGRMLNESRILEKLRADTTMALSPRDLAATYFDEARRVLNDASADLAKSPQPGASQPTPRKIWQYWNTPDMPEEIELTVESWRAQAGWQHRRMSQSDALAWLRDVFDEDHARAFRLANHIAEAADFLRLCLLLAEGGIYADADDKRTACIDPLIRGNPGILLFREPAGAISNNFICSTPGHPILVRAVDMARTSLLARENDGTWSKTGPGLLTRAAALHVIDNPDAARRDTRILPRNILRRFVHPHLAIPYKSTPRYWNTASDRTSAAMRSALMALGETGSGSLRPDLRVGNNGAHAVGQKPSQRHLSPPRQ